MSFGSGPSLNDRRRRNIGTLRRRSEDWHEIKVAVAAGIILLLLTNGGTWFLAQWQKAPEDRYWQRWAAGANRNYDELLDRVPLYKRPAAKP